jgi:hypothetical protein
MSLNDDSMPSFVHDTRMKTLMNEKDLVTIAELEFNSPVSAADPIEVGFYPYQ